MEHPCDETCQLYPTVSLADLLGETVHTFFDGMAIMTSFGRAAGTRLLTLFAVQLHQLPKGLSLAAFLLATGLNQRPAALSTMVLGAASVLQGLVAARFGGAKEQLVTGFLAFAAGTSLHAGATDPIPATNARRSRVSLSLVIVGVAVFYAISQLLR